MGYKKQKGIIATNVRGQCLEYSQKEVTSINDIDKGDHLCTERDLYFHHFIVTANYVKEGRRLRNGKQFEIIEYNGPQVGAKAKVVAEQKNLNDFTNLWKVNYLDGESYGSDVVVERAETALGKEGYNLIWNNCEHFANYCKTGKRTSIQVKNATRKTGGGAVNLIKDIIRKIRKGKRATGKLTKGGVAVTSVIEAVLAAEDIYRLYQMSEEGRISEEKFVEAVLHRLVTTVGSVWGSCVGGAMGGAAAGLPGFWLGGFLGNLLGGTIFGIGYDVALSLLESYNAKLE